MSQFLTCPPASSTWREADASPGPVLAGVAIGRQDPAPRCFNRHLLRTCDLAALSSWKNSPA
jgi:hypothetical protein